jgi:hypothetical protein
MIAEIKLGLCNPPEPIYLYVKNGELSGESYLWYNYNINNEKTIPVQQRGLTGYLQNLRLTSKEFRGQSNLKLDIVIAADEIYIVRTGIETNFAKTFLLAVSQVKDFSKPLIIAATPGEENVVFCRLYDAATKIRIRSEWNRDADWAGIISNVQSKLVATSEEVSSPQQQTQANQSVVFSALEPNQDVRVKQIRILLNYPVELVVEWLQFQGVELPNQLKSNKIDELVKTMCLYWGQDKFENSDFANNSYQKSVVGAMNNGISEIEAIKAWMENISEREILETV